jgi:DHA2 family methylenomycin A resistance protein-like MFS transporter
VPREAWIRLAVCTATATLLQLDGTLITVALPSAGHELGVGAHTIAWVLTAYFLSYAGFLLPGGRLVDRLGSRPVALVGLAVFGAGALAGALAPSFAVLVVTRVVQGAGAGLVSPAAMAGAVSGFPPQRRGTALGLWGAGSGMANLAGPLVGGVLTVLAGWRADWWVLVPLTLLAGAAVARLVPRAVRGQAPAAGGQSGGGRVVAAAAFIAGLTFCVMIGCFYLAQQYLQHTAGFSALGAGATLVFVALLVGFAAPLAGRLADRGGERAPVTVGLLCAGAALLGFGAPGMPLSQPVALALLVPVGLGLGLLFAPTSRAALNAVPEGRHGRTSATLSAARLIGAAVGAALAGVALSGGITAGHVHLALLIAGAGCLVLGLPAAAQFSGRSRAAARFAVTGAEAPTSARAQEGQDAVAERLPVSGSA